MVVGETDMGEDSARKGERRDGPGSGDAQLVSRQCVSASARGEAGGGDARSLTGTSRQRGGGGPQVTWWLGSESRSASVATSSPAERRVSVVGRLMLAGSGKPPEVDIP